MSVGHQSWSQPFIRIASFCFWHLCHSLLLATLWFFYEALKLIRLLTTLVINSGVRWSLKMVTILSSHRKFFRWHLSDNSLLATSWGVFYEALKRILLITTLFINNVVCWWPKVVTTLLFASQVFLLTLFSQFASILFVNSVLRSFEAFTAFRHFHQQCCLLVTNDGHNFFIRMASFSADTFFTVRFCHTRKFCFTKLWSVECLITL